MLAVPRCSGGFSSERFWIDGLRLRADTEAPQRGKGRAVPERCSSICSSCRQLIVGDTGGWFVNEISQSNRIKDVLSLQVAREHARQSRGSPNRHISKLNDH